MSEVLAKVVGYCFSGKVYGKCVLKFNELQCTTSKGLWYNVLKFNEVRTVHFTKGSSRRAEIFLFQQG